MKSRKFLTPLIVCLIATPPFLLLAIGSAGAGHGDYFWAKVLFPFTLLSARIFDSITAPFIAVAIVQFPLYGLMLGSANVQGRLRQYSALLLLIHSLTVLACFFFLRENFS